MSLRLGYLLPTREHVMAGRSEAGSLIGLASRAAGLGFDSLWVGDSVLARPRHDPLNFIAKLADVTRPVSHHQQVYGLRRDLNIVAAELR